MYNETSKSKKKYYSWYYTLETEFIFKRFKKIQYLY